MLPELQVTHHTAHPIYANNKKLTLKKLHDHNGTFLILVWKMFSYFYCNAKPPVKSVKNRAICKSASGSFCYSESVNEKRAALISDQEPPFKILTPIIWLTAATLPTELESPPTQEGSHQGQNLFHLIVGLTKDNFTPPHPRLG